MASKATYILANKSQPCYFYLPSHMELCMELNILILIWRVYKGQRPAEFFPII